ncbi:MAG: putative sulfotransferase [Acidimicrobiales bacterium]|nr:MAG: putative sulfotransferase [Acidimicrobiales bacterium]
MATERPAPVRITDLVAPEYPDEIAAAFDMVTPLADVLDWSPDAILRQAAAETGLDDFGDDLHVEPLGVLAAAMIGEGELSTLGRLSNHGTLVAHAKQKLLAVDLLKRHPEIHEIEIRRPVVIAGQGRTGTTHLHNLMSSDPSFRTMPYWESLEPVPPLAEQGVNHGTDFRADPRYQRCAETLAGLNGALPYFKRMHDMYPEHVHEEIALLAIVHGGMAPETMAVMPTWRDWYLASDQVPYYAFMKTMLQIMTFLGRGTEREADRWLLKSPQHVERLGDLITVFPDATVVCTHRDPVAVAKSMSTMLTYTSRMSRDPAKLVDVGRYWIDRMAIMFRSMADDRHLVPADQSTDVLFHEFMADDIATVEGIYALADHPFDASTRGAMDAYMADHPRGVHGSVTYHIEEDFGVDTEALAADLAFYVDRFGVRVEASR